MKRILQSLAGAITAFLLLVAPATGAAGTPRTQTWDLSGQTTINFTCINNCSPPAVPHLINITSNDLLTGAFSGTGYYTVDPSYTWNVTGNVVGNAVSMHILYTGTNAGYYVDAVGTIDANGYISGTAADGVGNTFTWYAVDTVAMTDYNHGQFVRNYADKTAIAQSNLGMPVTSH